MKLYNSNCEAVICEQVFSTLDGMTIKWNYESKIDDLPRMTITVVNPAIEAVEQIKQLGSALFRFGYEGDVEPYFSGFVDSYEYREGNIDKELEIRCIEQDKVIFSTLSVSYKSDTTADYIITDIAKRSGFNIKQLDLTQNKTYLTGYCVYGKPLNEIREIAEDCGANVKLEGKDLYVYNTNINKNQAVVLDFESGLLEEPRLALKSKYEELSKKPEEREKTTYTHTVRSLAIPLIKLNSIVIVRGEREEFTGQVTEMTVSDNFEAEYKMMKRD